MGSEKIKRKPGTIHVVVTAVCAGLTMVLGGFGIFAGGMLSFYPGVIVYTIAGLWFGAWGWLATYIGTALASFITGEPLIIAAFSGIINVIKTLISSLPFKLTGTIPDLRSAKSWAFWLVFCNLAQIIGGFLGSYQAIYITKWLPASMWWFGVASWAVSDIILNMTIGTAILITVTPALTKTRAFVHKWIA
jgi:hypothetical protein